jgi:L,D-transpeptidase YcbB
MRKFYALTNLISILLLFVSCSGTPKAVAPGNSALETQFQTSINQQSNIPFDSTLIGTFYTNHPELKKYEKNVTDIYRQHNFHEIWFDQKGVVEFGHSLYSKAKDLEMEGIFVSFPYQAKIDGVFLDEVENTLTEAETEIMLSNLFLFYAEKVYNGIDEKATTSMGWLLPRKQLSYVSLLDSIMTKQNLENENQKVLFRQYYRLREVLTRYREIEKSGGWKHIDFSTKLKAYKPEDTSNVILLIRERLFITGELAQNNQSNKYDDELLAAIKKYQVQNGFNPVRSIEPKHIMAMNVPVGERIKQIVVNMERCRWISPEIVKSKELVVVNIPSYKLNFYRDGKSELESAVVVGKNLNKTVIFSGKMSNVVFSPYWNVPQSILNKEIKPGIAKNPNYLETHNMEWHNGQVRQKPGMKNSLGLVKFIFPNSNDIYLHDTPSKSLFEKENRAFSHGCIRVAKPRELALKLLENDSTWTPKKVDAAMNAGVEKWVSLKEKIPVYIGYFTAWVNEKGEISFYNDVYKRDENLFKLLTNSQ